MKKIVLLFPVLFSLLLMNGCATPAFLAVSTALTAKSAYNGYETLSGMKNVQDKTGVFRDYRNAFISFEVQPRKGSSGKVDRTLESVYSRTLTGMARDCGLNLVCTPYELDRVKASSDALIIQVRERRPSFWGKIMSGEKIHASVLYMDKRTATNLVVEDYGGYFKNYEELVRILTRSALTKLNASAKPGHDLPSDEKNIYPVMTVKEKAILVQG